MSKSPAIQSVLIHGQALEAQALNEVQLVLSALVASGVAISVTESFAALLLECGVDAQQYGIQNAAVDHRPDMVLSLGGDGTVLETAALEAVEGIPVLGINTGRLGFLAHLPLQGASEAMASIMAGSYIVESRNRLEIEFLGMDVDLGRYALNEVTVHRRDVASMIRISVHRDGTFVNRYWADGLIVSTATGSTAYSLSCGGPIVHPDSNAIVLNPIAPHNLNDRPLVIPADGTLEIHAEGRDDHLMLTLDSRSHKVKAPARFKVRPASRPFLLVQLPGVDFIETVRRKLHFGMDGREGPSSAAHENPTGSR